MAGSRAEALLRKPGQPPGASYLELFFDLVFVFALTQLSQWLLEEMTSRHHIVLAGQALLLLLTLMMLWFATAWLTDLLDPRRPEIQLVIAGAMFSALVMAVSLPGAFGSLGLSFAGAYVGAHIGRGLVLVATLRGHEAQRRSVGALLWFTLSAVPWIIGATFAHGFARGALWTLAITIEYTAVMLLFAPVPRIHRPRLAQWPIAAEHMAERYQQFFLIVLGELVAVTGATDGAHYLENASATAAFFMSFATTVLLWLTYLYRAGALLPAAFAAVPVPARLVRRALLAHVVMVAGIVATDAGFELVIANPRGYVDLPWLCLIVGGPVAFLAGRVLFGHMIFARVSKSRVIGALLLAGISPALIFLPPLAITITVALVLAGIVTSDVVLARGHPPKPPSPPS
ncbi:low temperature requirement protein A [Phytohabitans sp. ZYX-F-186]|uniref:Low temperature requirement protein A n=1 Tax=Phytohabitans maris TaxID=3071409 RepID=A0ABU0ZPG5_9ACTN|nr:low temperature requirement protein A [Phytohabitans sp. ZYX-F-186]MDQ7908244.1 low temperature requirement protein A [Phytohabitans sp. ZYX-F-186]